MYIVGVEVHDYPAVSLSVGSSKKLSCPLLLTTAICCRGFSSTGTELILPNKFQQQMEASLLEPL